MQLFLTGETITDAFIHYQADTGLDQGNFNITLILNGALSQLLVTIEEIGSGFYRTIFTPNEKGLWNLHVQEVGDSTVYYVSSYNVIDDDIERRIAEQLRRSNDTMQRIDRGIQGLQPR
jgi:predicted HTH transcriptional regulator